MDGYLVAGIVLAVVAIAMIGAACSSPDSYPMRLIFGDKAGGGGKGKTQSSAKVVSLSSAAEFDDVLSGKRGKAMLLLYSDGCGHCHRMMPEFEKAAAAGGSGVTFARMSSKHGSPELFQRLKVTGVPALYAVKGPGSYEPHIGGRNQDALLKIAGEL